MTQFLENKRQGKKENLSVHVSSKRVWVWYKQWEISRESIIQMSHKDMKQWDTSRLKLWNKLWSPVKPYDFIRLYGAQIFYLAIILHVKANHRRAKYCMSMILHVCADLRRDTNLSALKFWDNCLILRQCKSTKSLS